MKNVEDAKEVIVGKRYLVNTVEVLPEQYYHWWNGGIVPVLGLAHEDADLIGIKDRHFHIDWRFVPLKNWERGLGFLYQKNHSMQGAVLWEYNPMGPVTRKALLCRRTHDVFPIVQFTKQLQKTFADKKSDCRTCPHRGISLVGAPVNFGAVVCPGHGLAWNIETGELAPRI